MKQSRYKQFANSISFKLTVAVFLIVIPLIILSIHGNFQSRDLLLAQVHATHGNMLQSYMEQIDSQLRTSMAYTVNLALYENDPSLAATSYDKASIEYAKIQSACCFSARVGCTSSGFFNKQYCFQPFAPLEQCHETYPGRRP